MAAGEVGGKTLKKKVRRKEGVESGRAPPPPEAPKRSVRGQPLRGRAVLEPPEHPSRVRAAGAAPCACVCAHKCKCMYV